ncbi:MAG: nucleotide exchange factor GrpE [Proteobacteria bacterium]|nr:nucleotide exchange factor GrpE [Pseudomonadota bacterium]
MKKSVFDRSSSSENDNNQQEENDVEGQNNLSNLKIPVNDAESDPVSKLELEVKEHYDKYIRLVAEFENYKKRTLKERADLLKYAGENLAKDLLEVADNFSLALAQDMTGVKEEFVKGFKMISDNFIAVLNKHSINSESAIGVQFDPNKHQALASVPTPDKPNGTVIEEFKKAYYLKDKLLRPAQVVVSTVPESDK